MSDKEAAESWVETNMTWDDYEAQWVESGVKTFLAGVEYERARRSLGTKLSLGKAENSEKAAEEYASSVRVKIDETNELVRLAEGPLWELSKRGYWTGLNNGHASGYREALEWVINVASKACSDEDDHLIEADVLRIFIKVELEKGEGE
jgi:hypothetical protein